MLEYDRIDISEGIDVNKSNDKSKECGICHYLYFLNKNLSYQPHLCNGKESASLMDKSAKGGGVTVLTNKSVSQNLQKEVVSLCLLINLYLKISN